jgi:tetratricopeptide (TPR) repeat protein
MTRFNPRLSLFATTAAIAFAAYAFTPAPSFAAGTPDPAPVVAPDGKKPDEKPDPTKADAPKPDVKPADANPSDAKPDPGKKSDNQFLDGYKKAYALIYDAQDYSAGIVALKALGHDEHPDVANLIGFSSRKLGRTEDAKVWYEKALAADPNHTRTWQYYGMWQLEQGDRAKAEENLEKIRLISGQDCDDYKSLQAALNGKMTY